MVSFSRFRELSSVSEKEKELGEELEKERGISRRWQSKYEGVVTEAESGQRAIEELERELIICIHTYINK